MADMEVILASAENCRVKDPAQATALFMSVLGSALLTDGVQRSKEQAILGLASVYRDSKRPAEFAELLSQSRPFLAAQPKAKSAKMLRTLIDMFSEIPECLGMQVAVCRDAIEWAAQEKRVFLKQALETRLAAMYLANRMFSESLLLISRLLSELKRLDDKIVLADVQLLESRVYHAIRNIPKAKASLSSARTTANSIYCPPAQQAQLDMQSGILNAEDRDFKTAYSYFFETLEGYASIDDPRAVTALKYMLLCKIMLNLPQEAATILHQKIPARNVGKDTDAMLVVAQAMQSRSLHDFEEALTKYKDELTNDPVIHRHLAHIYGTLLEQNLVRVIEPFSRVEIGHVAQLVKLPQQQVEQKLSQLILDGKIHGILDQDAAVLITFVEQPADEAYANAIETVKKMGTVVNSLYLKASKLS